MELAHLQDIHLVFLIYLAVNKLITDITQNIFYFIHFKNIFLVISTNLQICINFVCAQCSASFIFIN